MNCPECSHEFEVSVFATIPERQTLYMKLTGEGEMFNAKTIGEAMIHLAQVQIEIAKAMGEKVQVMLQSFEVRSNEVTIGFCIAEHIKKPLPRELKDAVAQIHRVYGNDLGAFFSDAQKAYELRNVQAKAEA